MNDPFLVPCLVTLRAEFNAVAPRRDKGADGWIGDRAHAMSVSDHNPDETGATPYEDADNVDEVHGLDVDCTGPWEDGKGGEAGGWFDRQILRIAEQERIEYESPTILGRLQNIIWRGRIISRSWGWSGWRTYSGPSKHFDHAHFSARYLSSTEADTRPWGVYEEDDVALTADDKKWLVDNLGPAKTWGHPLEDPRSTKTPKATKSAGTWLRYQEAVTVGQGDRVAVLAGKDQVDEQAIIAGILAGLPPEAIAAAIPDELAEQVAQKLADRLAS